MLSVKLCSRAPPGSALRPQQTVSLPLWPGISVGNKACATDAREASVGQVFRASASVGALSFMALQSSYSRATAVVLIHTSLMAPMVSSRRPSLRHPKPA
jgi:hypothetical protein